jgi:hypothetical protein
LTHPEFHWRIVTLCRAEDLDRAPKFSQVLQKLGADGEMANLDDGPDQVPLPPEQVQETAIHFEEGADTPLQSWLKSVDFRLDWRIFIAVPKQA